MEKLRKKIKSYSDIVNEDDQIINELDKEDLNYIDNMMNDLNSSGREHVIKSITKKDNTLSIKAEYSMTYFKK